ncbi:MAG TPA: hypothetical protein VFN92_08245 [Solirubrobacterales bacterium]|nr:hypothetical protein [Solirubrobacterales bacterium]
MAGIAIILDPDDVPLEFAAAGDGRSGYFVLSPLKVPRPQRDQQWGSNIDTEGELSSGGKDKNIEIPPKLRIVGADAEDFRDRQLQLEQKLNKYGSGEGGIFRLVYPDGSWIDYEIRGVNGGEGLIENRVLHSWVAEEEVTFVCAPFGVGQEELVGEYSSSDRVMEISVPELDGTAEALARAEIVSPDADVWELLWGRDSRYFDEAPTAAAEFAAKDLTPVGGAGEVTTTIDGKAGVTVVRQGMLTPNWSAMLDLTIDGVGPMTHQGVFELLAWVHMPTTNTGEVAVSAEYGIGDLSRSTSLEPIYFPAGHPRQGQVVRLSLGQLWLRAPARGEHQWEGQVLVKSTVVGDDFDILEIGMRPVGESNGRVAVTPVLKQPSTLLTRDEFGQPAGALDGQPLAAAAAIAGPKSPTVVAQSGTGVAWTNPNNVKASDNTYAQVVLGSGGQSQKLNLSDFDLTIPEGATIDGIEAVVEHRCSATAAGALRLHLRRAGVTQGSERGSSGSWPTSDTAESAGGPADLWGATPWTPTELTDPEFGIELYVQQFGTEGTKTIFIDRVTVVVYFTEPAAQDWDTFGDAADLEVDGGEDLAKRTATNDASMEDGRYAIAGTTKSTDIVVGLAVKRSSISAVGAGERIRGGALARFVDEDNWLFFGLDVDAPAVPPAEALRIFKRVGGADPEELDGVAIPYQYGVYRRIWLQVDRRGRYFAWGSLVESGVPRLLMAGQDNDLVGGGPLDDGKTGFYDVKMAASTCTRYYDNFVAWIPPLDAVIFEGRALELAHDRVEREPVEGGRWVPLTPEVDYLKLAPAGMENRQNRLVFIASPHDPELMGVGFPEELRVALYVTPRYRGVPDPA